MDQLLYIITSSVQFFITALMMLLFLRVIINFFSDSESNFYIFCCVVTEPVVAPVRTLLGKIPALEDFPIDFSFMATYLILFIVQSALPV